jgi:hypothetical protein
MGKKQQIIHTSWFTDPQIEMILNKLSILFDALPIILTMGIPAVVVIVYIIWGDGK